jgi:threonine dehydrogenase-like Zn-dependent dehydrogenase
MSLSNMAGNASESDNVPQKTTGDRYRINVSRTSTGKYGWDCTVECVGQTAQETFEKSNALVKMLEAKYPNYS